MQISAQLCSVVQNAEQCAVCSAVCSVAQLVLRSWEGAGEASVFITNTGGLYHLPHLMRMVMIISLGMM